jgi:hypothetical protein
VGGGGSYTRYMIPLSLIAAAAQATTTPTFVDILRSMHGDYRKLTAFRESWTIKTEDGDVGVLMVRTIDGQRFLTEASQKGQRLVEQGYDGANFWYVSYGDKVYGKAAFKNVWHTEAFSEPKFEGEPGVNFTMSGGYDFNIAVSPSPVISKIENGHLGGTPIRKVTGSVDIPNRPKPATIQLWFERDAWILRRIEARWKGADGKDHFFVGAGTIERGAKLDPKVFMLDTIRVAGFTQKPIPGLGG